MYILLMTHHEDGGDDAYVADPPAVHGVHEAAGLSVTLDH
jgi:hypothetical protein